MVTRLTARNRWFSPWTRRTVRGVSLVFLIMLVLEFPFVFFFDTVLTQVGFLYVYVWAFPQATLLYFVAFKLRARWTSTVIVGLAGLIGAPIDYYLEWVVHRNLIAPSFAFMYIPLYLIAGLSADLSLMALHPEQRPLRAAVVSAFTFTATVLLTTVVVTYLFYPGPPTLEGTWLEFGYFLIPYALATGAIGGYLGFSLARDSEIKQRTEARNS
jgi:hypothetical protein